MAIPQPDSQIHRILVRPSTVCSLRRSHAQPPLLLQDFFFVLPSFLPSLSPFSPFLLSSVVYTNILFAPSLSFSSTLPPPPPRSIYGQLAKCFPLSLPPSLTRSLTHSERKRGREGERETRSRRRRPLRLLLKELKVGPPTLPPPPLPPSPPPLARLHLSALHKEEEMRKTDIAVGRGR